uniref:Uncharacterized protein n=1 Tax=Pseudo-nitzschia australis TaxID=44445 RepID=A0A7S4EPJ9_9STRA
MMMNKSAEEYNNEEQVPQVLVAVNSTAAKIKTNATFINGKTNLQQTNLTGQHHPADGKTNLHNLGAQNESAVLTMTTITRPTKRLAACRLPHHATVQNKCLVATLLLLVSPLTSWFIKRSNVLDGVGVCFRQ